MRAIAPGKIILSGEHAVVYGRPALVMAINRCAESTLAFDEPAAAGGDTDARVHFEMPDMAQPESFTLAILRELHARILRSYKMFLDGKLGIREVLHKPVELLEFSFINLLDGLHLKLGGPLKLRTHSNIPIGCGLGSSAATVLSVLRAAGHYFRVDFRPDWYMKYSIEAERLQHGYSSGVDPYISLHGGCVRYQPAKPEAGTAREIRSIPLPSAPLYLVNTGTPESSTGECVSQVRRQHGASGIWDECARVTDNMAAALAAGDACAMRAAIRENHRLLCALGVVPARVQAFVADVERRGGAAKICGAGSVSGAGGGMALVWADRRPADLCQAYGFEPIAVQGDPLGVRIIE